MYRPTISRRRFLACSVSGMAIGVSGCLGSTDDFEYPPGFSEDGVQGNLAFGFGSPMDDDLDSVSLFQREMRTTDAGEIVMEGSVEFNRIDDEYARTWTDPFTLNIETVAEFFDGHITYLRLRYIDGDIDFNQLAGPARTYRALTMLDFLTSITEDVALEQVEINENVHPREAVFHTDTQGMESNARIQSWAEHDGPFTHGEMTLVIDEEGMVHSLRILAEFERGTRSWEIEYEGFNDVTVTEPDWLDEAKRTT